MGHRLLILLIAIDHLIFAVLTLGSCRRGETISAAAWALEQNGKLQGKISRPVIDWLFTWIERDHCQVSCLAEMEMYRSFQ